MPGRHRQPTTLARWARAAAAVLTRTLTGGPAPRTVGTHVEFPKPTTPPDND